MKTAWNCTFNFPQRTIFACSIFKLFYHLMFFIEKRTFTASNKNDFLMYFTVLRESISFFSYSQKVISHTKSSHFKSHFTSLVLMLFFPWLSSNRELCSISRKKLFQIELNTLWSHWLRIREGKSALYLYEYCNYLYT